VKFGEYNGRLYETCHTRLWVDVGSGAPCSWRHRTDPAGEELSGDAHVFGDPIGRPIVTFKPAWEATEAPFRATRDNA